MFEFFVDIRNISKPMAMIPQSEKYFVGENVTKIGAYLRKRVEIKLGLSSKKTNKVNTHVLLINCKFNSDYRPLINFSKTDVTFCEVRYSCLAFFFCLQFIFLYYCRYFFDFDWTILLIRITLLPCLLNVFY